MFPPELMRERNNLIQKLLNETITRAEEVRLGEINAIMDKIEHDSPGAKAGRKYVRDLLRGLKALRRDVEAAIQRNKAKGIK